RTRDAASCNTVPVCSHAVYPRPPHSLPTRRSSDLALMIAAAKGHADVVELLVRAGADVEAQTEHGDTALSIARARGDQKVIKLLDRKSTRLNSSRVSISYAVFCLKKKIKNKVIITQ